MLKHMRLVLVVSIILIANAACSIQIAMKINEDYSGSVETIIDISQMMSFTGAMDSLSEEQKDSVVMSMSLEDELTDSMRLVLDSVGISNMKFGVDMESMTMSYDFADINHAYDFFTIFDTVEAGEEAKPKKDFAHFRIEADKFYISFTDDGMSNMMGETMGDGMESEDMDMSFMTNLFSIEQSYEFERKIKEVVDNDLPIRVKDNRVYYTVNLSEYMNEFVGKEIIIEFDKGKTKGKKN